MTRSTITKELSALRGFLAHCEEEGLLGEAPRIKAPPRKAVGTRASVRRTVQLSLEQVQKILSELPVTYRATKPRAFYTLLWETGLRKATLERLVASDYRAADEVLEIRDEADKARFGRVLPLTPKARAVLDEVCREPGEIFGKRDMRTTLRRAAQRAGLSEGDVAALSNHDFRHARTTYLLEHSDNLVGVAFLLGHKEITTTNRYVKPRQKAARSVLAAANSGAHSGARGLKAKSPAEAGLIVSDRNHSAAEERTRTSTRFPIQEPERAASDRNHMVSGEIARQGASACDTVGPDSGAAHQNPDPILEALVSAARSWSELRDRDALRRQLREVLETLEDR